MKTILTVLAATSLIAACDRPAQPKTEPAASGASAPTQPLPQTSSPQPGAATTEEQKESSNPQQGQVDPKDASQHRDFQQRGDGAGPKPGG